MNKERKYDQDKIEKDMHISENSNKSSWDSLNKLKKESTRKFQSVSDQNFMSSSTPNFYPNRNRQHSHSHSRSQSGMDDHMGKSHNSNNSGSLNFVYSQSNHTSHNTNNDVEFLNTNFNNLSAEEIKAQLEVIKKSYEKKISEIDSIYKEINAKDEKINQLTEIISGLLKEEEIAEKERSGKNMCENTEEEINMRMKQASELKIEINNLKRKHNKKLKDLERENEENLNSNLEKIRDEYNMRIREFSEAHDKNIKTLQEEILNMKNKFEKLENKNLYMNKSSHEEIMNDLKNIHQKELLGYEKEIEKLELLIRENFPQLVTKNKNNTEKNENSNFLNYADLHKELQNGTDNNDIICIISQLDTPMCNSLQQTASNIINTNPANRRNVNLSMNNLSNAAGNFNSSNYMTNTHHNNYVSNKYNIDFDEDTGIIEEDESVYEEVPINKINNFNIDKGQFFDSPDN